MINTDYVCPQCNGDAVRCLCDALPLPVQRLILDAVEAQIRDVEHALDVIADETTPTQSLLWQGCLEYLLENTPEELREMIRQRFEQCFGITAKYRGEDGSRLYTIEQVAEALGITIEEAVERADALIKPSNRPQCGDAHRVQ